MAKAKYLAVGILAAVFAIGGTKVFADTNSVDFESYTIGTVNGQDGWSSLGAAGSGCAVYDHAVSSSLGTTGFGTNSLRVSNSVTSGCFGDQTFSKSLTDAAGETLAESGASSSAPVHKQFTGKFDIASAVPGSEQTGLVVSISPDRGDGARMSYLRFEDKADGIHVFFDDYQDLAPFGGAVGDSNGCNGTDDFIETDIATINRASKHNIKFVMQFVDGPRNDIVKIYIDDVLKHTGTSWEDYFRYCEGNETRTVDSLLFRTGGTAAPATSGNGFLFDNLQLESGPIPTNDCVFVTSGDQYKLQADCTTTATILIPQGKTLNGQGYTITAKDPSGGHFLGAVVKNEGDKAGVKNLKIYAGELAIVCDDGADRLRGILFDGASGKIENNKILAVNQGDSGCQEGNGIEVRNFGPGDSDITTGYRKSVKIKNNLVQDFNKGGIVANGYIRVKISDNEVKSPGLTAFTAANGIQLAFNAKGTIKYNHVEGNQWSGGDDWAATAILLYLVEDPVVKDNYITGNSDIGIAVEDTYGAVVKNNKVKDYGADLNADGYDIGIENAYYNLNEEDGEANFFCGNSVSGFNTPFYGVDQKRCGKYKHKHHNHHGRHHGHCQR